MANPESAGPAAQIHVKGSGPVALTCMLLLAQTGTDGLHLHARPWPIEDDTSRAVDPRAIALSRSSWALLESLGVTPPVGARPIRHVHVSQQGRLGRTRIDSDRADLPLGWVVSYDSLLDALRQACTNLGIEPKSETDAPTAEGEHNSHGLTVLAEGGLFDPHAQVDPSENRHDYQSSALLALVRLQRQQAGCAWERFTRHGPVALLPAPHLGPEHACLVWCGPHEQANRYLADPSLLTQELQQLFASRLGQLDILGNLVRFPLGRIIRPLQSQHAVRIGNGAQTIHPVAGQGLNLGLRDAAALAHALLPWRQHQLSLEQALRRYARQRRLDRSLVLQLTHWAPRLFSTQLPLVEHACGIALFGMDVSGPLRRGFAQLLMRGLPA